MFLSTMRRLSARGCLATALAMLMLSAVFAEPPEEAPRVPLDARGFTAGQFMQEQYARKLERDAAAPTSKAVRPAPKQAAAQTKSKTAVTIASAPPGGSTAAKAGANSPSVGSRIRAFFSGGSASRVPQPSASLPYLGR
jgi:hypothetical protein